MPTPALLDTHSFLWFIGGSERLSATARALIADRDNPMLVSVASLWEIAIKNGMGKLVLSRPFHEFIPAELERQQIGMLEVRLSHLSELVHLPEHHRDPFDRLLVAQARVEGLPIVSVDAALDPYGIQRLW